MTRQPQNTISRVVPPSTLCSPFVVAAARCNQLCLLRYHDILAIRLTLYKNDMCRYHTLDQCLSRKRGARHYAFQVFQRETFLEVGESLLCQPVAISFSTTQYHLQNLICYVTGFQLMNRMQYLWCTHAYVKMQKLRLCSPTARWHIFVWPSYIEIQGD